MLLLLVGCGPAQAPCGAGTHEKDGVCFADVGDSGRGDADADTDTDTDTDADTDADTDTDSGGDDVDDDSDGYVEDDCNDADASVHPGADEASGDNLDNDCDGYVDELEVCANGMYRTIMAGVYAAVDGDIVQVCPGTYVETLRLSTTWVGLVSEAGSADTIVDANGAGIVLLVENGQDGSLPIEGFTLTGGDHEYGGGVQVWQQSAPAFRDMVITGNSGRWAGGIYLDNSASTFEDVAVTANTALSGATIASQGIESPSFTRVLVADNYSDGDAGGIAIWGGGATILNSVIVNNTGAGTGYALDIAKQAEGVVVYNTVVAANDGNGSWAFHTELGTGDYRNNIIAFNSGGHGFSAWSGGGGYNLSYGNNGYNFFLNGDEGEVGATDIEADPQLTSVAAGDVSLLPTSPAINAGDPGAEYNDPDGTRNDLGAHGGPFATE